MCVAFDWPADPVAREFVDCIRKAEILLLLHYKVIDDFIFALHFDLYTLQLRSQSRILIF